MGMNMILSIIVGIVMTAIIGSQVAPSMIEKVKATKVEAKAINNQEVIFEAVKRYITMKQTNPTSLQDIIDEQFLNAKVNDNGFDGGYEIEIDGSKGLLKIKTTIKDPKAQEIFLNSFKNKFIPTRIGTNEFETTFVIPTDIMHGRGLFMTGIPVQATPPTDTSLKYWYDTSGKEVALRMYDPNSDSWKKVAGTGGSGSISESALVDASGNNFTKDTLPTTNAEVGEIKYAYDSTTNTIQEYVYTGADKGWVAKGSAGYNKIYPKSCLEYKTYGKSVYPYLNSDSDGVYKIDPDGRDGLDPFEVYCDMTTDGGGWTLIMKTSSLNNTFPYSSPYWSNDSTLNANDTNISTNTDMKNIGYSTIPLTEVRFCLDTITNCLQEKKEAINLKILLNNKSTTIYTRANFLNWEPSSIPQAPNNPYCNDRGYNIRNILDGGGYYSSCRFGIQMNDENDCGSPNLIIGFGCETIYFGSGINNTSSGRISFKIGGLQKKGWIFIR